MKSIRLQPARRQAFYSRQSRSFNVGTHHVRFVTQSPVKSRLSAVDRSCPTTKRSAIPVSASLNNVKKHDWARQKWIPADPFAPADPVRHPRKRALQAIMVGNRPTQRGMCRMTHIRHASPSGRS
ncbi:hypothetical protein FZX02_04930 [Synechococcus sp. MU1644]|nr:hypothetical protein [Synechococcus sp. MU1644]